jgi:hypothetical protein
MAPFGGFLIDSMREENAVLLKEARKLRGSCVKQPDILEPAAG